MSITHSLGLIGLLGLIGKPLFYVVIIGSATLAAMIALLHYQVSKACPTLVYDLSMGSPGNRGSRWLSGLRQHRHTLPPRVSLLHTATLTVQYALVVMGGLLVLDALVLASTRI